jgi:hypothetical protein
MSPLSNNGEASSFTQIPAAQSLPDLTGKTPAEADQELEKAGFKQGKTTAGGYQHWKHSDGSEIWIRLEGGVCIEAVCGAYRIFQQVENS